MKLRLTHLFAGLATCLASVTAQAQEPKFEFRLGGVSQLSVRNALLASDASSSNGSTGGVDLGLRWKQFGFAVRAHGGTFDDSGPAGGSIGDLAFADAMLLMGPRVTALHLGYGLRGSSSVLGASSFSFARAGLTSAIEIGGTGISAVFSGGLLVPSFGETEATGFELETSLIWAPRRFPVFAQFGYRHEQFNLVSGDFERPEETGSVVLSGGLRLSR